MSDFFDSEFIDDIIIYVYIIVKENNFSYSINNLKSKICLQEKRT